MQESTVHPWGYDGRWIELVRLLLTLTQAPPLPIPYHGLASDSAAAPPRARAAWRRRLTGKKTMRY